MRQFKLPTERELRRMAIEQEMQRHDVDIKRLWKRSHFSGPRQVASQAFGVDLPISEERNCDCCFEFVIPTLPYTALGCAACAHYDGTFTLKPLACMDSWLGSTSLCNVIPCYWETDERSKHLDCLATDDCAGDPSEEDYPRYYLAWRQDLETLFLSATGWGGVPTCIHFVEMQWSVTGVSQMNCQEYTLSRSQSIDPECGLGTDYPEEVTVSVVECP